MPDNERGMYDKYTVTRKDGKPVEDALVIEYKDPQFFEILSHLHEVYKETRPQFAEDLKELAYKLHNKTKVDFSVAIQSLNQRLK